MASREFEGMMSGLVGGMVSSGDSTEVARDKLNALHGHPIAADTTVEWIELEAVRCARVGVPGTNAEAPLLFLCHGGAFIAAGGDGYLFYAEMLARACEANVLLVDYRLAPDHLHPAARNDCAAAYRGLIASGQAPDDVIFIGDSCGGTLVVTSLVEIVASGLPTPCAAVTLGGWFDLAEPSGPSDSPPGRDPFAHPDFTRARGRDYVGPNGDPSDPSVSPVHANLKGLPPLLLQVGSVDLTHGDAVRLREVANACGVDVTLEVHPEMIHGFQGLASAGIPEAHDALARVADFIRSRRSPHSRQP
ncbi:MAG: monoterpene epsilon-lactone hydrolase [Myxococcota bacterium]|jgi:monoterpene epsilon-lactone hydrolase